MLDLNNFNFDLNVITLTLISAILSPLVGSIFSPLFREWRERNVKREIIIESLKNHGNINELITNLGTYPKIWTIFIFAELIYFPITFITPLLLIYSTNAISAIFYPIEKLDSRIPYYIAILNSLPLFFTYLIYSLRFRSFKWIERSLEVSLREYSKYASKFVLFDFLILIAIIEAIVGLLPLDLALNKSIYLTFMNISLILLPWSYFKRTNKDILSQAKKELTEESFKCRPVFIRVSTRSGKSEGFLWDIFNRKTLILKKIDGSRIYIPWNEISWIEVIENKKQSNESPEDSETNSDENPPRDSEEEFLKLREGGIKIRLGLNRKTIETYHISFFSGLLASIAVTISVGAKFDHLRLFIAILSIYIFGLFSLRIWYWASNWKNNEK